MDELTIKLNEKIEEAYNILISKPLQVLNIFNDFFGEDRVDMQGYMCLEEFKSWINSTPLENYANSSIFRLDNSIRIHQALPITSLPDNLKEILINNFTNVVSSIGNNVFHKIFILVHFPTVKITNENDRYVNINHLWAKVEVHYNGTMKGSLQLNRSEYSLLHFISNYMHSHVGGIPKEDFTRFMSPCLGSGPIRNTITTLNREFDGAMWNMFCLELSRYVTVESIAGRPYFYLEKLGKSLTTGYNVFNIYISPYSGENILANVKFKEFIRYFITSRKLKFNYINNSYSIGMSFIEYLILISNEFIKWYNNKFNKKEVSYTLRMLKADEFLIECIISDGKVYKTKKIDYINSCNNYIGKKVCKFKGKDITLTITDFNELNIENTSLVLHPRNALYVLSIILKVLNYRYGRNNAIYTNNSVGTEVRYL